MLISESNLLVLAEKVVSRYVNKGVVPSREREDTQMIIVEKFLDKQKKIEDNYSGKANITTYCISVLNNMCCEVIRKELKHWKNELDDMPEGDSSNHYSASQKTIIQDEINYLDKILILFDKEKSKINIALSYYYQLELRNTDIVEYNQSYNKENISPIKINNDKINKGDIINNLSDYICQVENKNIKPDAVRMWLKKTTNTIVTRLNGPFGRTHYDQDSFQVLYELYNAQRS
jgi:hypothetical protein